MQPLFLFIQKGQNVQPALELILETTRDMPHTEAYTQTPPPLLEGLLGAQRGHQMLAPQTHAEAQESAQPPRSVAIPGLRLRTQDSSSAATGSQIEERG